MSISTVFLTRLEGLRMTLLMHVIVSVSLYHWMMCVFFLNLEGVMFFSGNLGSAQQPKNRYVTNYCLIKLII